MVVIKRLSKWSKVGIMIIGLLNVLGKSLDFFCFILRKKIKYFSQKKSNKNRNNLKSKSMDYRQIQKKKLKNR